MLNHKKFTSFVFQKLLLSILKSGYVSLEMIGVFHRGFQPGPWDLKNSDE